MLEEIHFAGSVRTPFGSFCGAFADVSAVELGKAPGRWSGAKPQDVKELLVGNILSAPTAQTPRARSCDRGRASSAAEWVIAMGFLNPPARLL
jgi:acetyl-CoA acetyltransferase